MELPYTLHGSLDATGETHAHHRSSHRPRRLPGLRPRRRRRAGRRVRPRLPRQRHPVGPGGRAAGGRRGRAASCPDWPLGAHRRPARPRRRPLAGRHRGTRCSICSTPSTCATSSWSAATPAAACASSRCEATPSRVGGLVLTNCDAFEQFPPRFFVPLFVMARSRARGVGPRPADPAARACATRRSAFGPLLNQPSAGRPDPGLDSTAPRQHGASGATSPASPAPCSAPS